MAQIINNSSIDISALPNFINENSTDILTKAFAKNNFLQSKISEVGGIKNSQKIHMMDLSLDWFKDVPGLTFDYDEASTVDLLDKVLTVTPVEFNIALDARKLNTVYMGMYNGIGSYSTTDENTVFQATLMNMLVEAIAADTENLLINSSTTKTGQLSYFDGLIKMIADDTSVVDLTNQGVITVNNVLDIVDAILASRNKNIITHDDQTMYMSFATFELLVIALRKANYFHYNQDDGQFAGFRFPTSNVWIMPLASFPENQIVFTIARNIIYGYDQKNDAQNFQSHYEWKDKQTLIRGSQKMGLQIHRGEYITNYIGS